MAKPHVLIVGSGSVGQRHARNFSFLGCEVSCMDPREDRLAQVSKSLSILHCFSRLEDALASADSFSGVVVCSPPKFHVEQAIQALDAKLPVLLEKPVSPDLASALVLEQRLRRGGMLLLGYTYRWWPPVVRLKGLIDDGVIGALRYARFTMSAHLADWHPWENYQDFFMSSRELGGGALLDESHFLDLMIWIFGVPERLFARVEKISDLDITTDDFVDISVVYPEGFRAAVHLDLFGRPHDKQIIVVGEKGTLQCQFSPDEIRVGHEAEAKWSIEPFEIERNDMFMAVAREFLLMVEGHRVEPTCGIIDGVKVLRVLETCRESQQSGREIRL